MSHETLSSVRETIQLARLQSLNLREDVANLDHLLRLSDEELPLALSIEDVCDIYAATPAYFR